jgi:hypothetical protein
MKRLAMAAVLIGLGACGGGGGPAAPSAASPVITTPNTTIYIGQTVQFAATGTGTIRWGGDAPGIATVDVPTGRVTGVGSGRVTIWAENDGGRTTRLLRGMPSYAGNWTGTYAITGCQSSGDLSAIRFCSDFFSIGDVLNMGFSLSQTDDRVTGSFSLGDVQGSLNSSTVAEAGHLPISGVATSNTVTITIQNARLDSPSVGTLGGNFEQSWTVSGASGSGIVSCAVRSVTRTSGGPTLRLQRPLNEPETVEDVIRRVLQR